MPEWLRGLSIALLIYTQVMIPGSWNRAPCGTPCWAWSLLNVLSPSASLPCLHSLEKIIIIKLKFNLKREKLRDRMTLSLKWISIKKKKKEEVSSFPIWDSLITFFNKLIVNSRCLHLYYSKPTIISSILQIFPLPAVSGSKFHQISVQFATLTLINTH